MPLVNRRRPSHLTRLRGSARSSARPRGIKLGGRVRLALFWEVYALLNSDNFNSYVGRRESPLFGQSTAAYEKRRRQGGIRIDF